MCDTDPGEECIVNEEWHTTTTQVSNQFAADQVPLLITTVNVNKELLAVPPEQKPEF